jgi:HK97 family phage prohead protease
MRDANKMRNEIRRDGQILSLANYRTEVRAEPNLKIAGKVFTNRLSLNMGDWWEKIARGAFSESIKNLNIYLLWQHDHKNPLANTKSGTLRIWEENDGYAFEADLPDTQMGRDVHKLISTGVVTGTSFAMSNIRDSWTEEGGKDVRIIESATLHEFSPVTWPAYESSYVAARSKTKNETQKYKNFFGVRKEEKK